ncbi:tyrosine-type recombinase/integrase [Listeria seeligeri]|uniref:tyrosine-type recombinase/integrase n=1 Tax=Listeria seeligeri TaxID=1640 RepID=UPI001E584391|nr:site-specific integrase [Listeria seeligeri]
MKIKKLKNGKYTVRLRIKIDGEWKEKRLTDESETNLMYKASRLLKQAEHDSSSLKEWKFKEFYELFIKTFKEGKSSPATIDLYELAYNQFISYFDEKIKLNSIDAVQYQQFINHLAVDYAIATVDTRHRKIRAIFNKAVHLGYMKKNPAIGAHISGQDVAKTKAQYMETDKVHLLLKELAKFHSVSRAVIFVAAQTGMRFEEIIALTKKDINLNKKIITLENAWDYKYTNFFVDTKTGDERTIYIDESTCQFLCSYMEWHDDYLKQYDLVNPYNLIFLTYHNKPVDNASCNKALKKLCKMIDSEPVTLHKLRHTHTGLCVEAGMDIIYVADRLGHSDINTTLKYYSHLSNNIRQQNQSKVDAFFTLETDKMPQFLPQTPQK